MMTKSVLGWHMGQKKGREKKMFCMLWRLLQSVQLLHNLHTMQPVFYSLWLSPSNCCSVKAAILILFSKKTPLPGWSNFLLSTCVWEENCHPFITGLFCVTEDIKHGLKLLWTETIQVGVLLRFNLVNVAGHVSSACLWRRAACSLGAQIALLHPLWWHWGCCMVSEDVTGAVSCRISLREVCGMVSHCLAAFCVISSCGHLYSPMTTLL